MWKDEEEKVDLRKYGAHSKFNQKGNERNQSSEYE
jgi:hypothetical protein